MEKLQIAKYGLMQVTAFIYGMLICGLGVKLARPAFEAGCRMSDSFYIALFFRDYGAVFFLYVLAWTGFSAYATSPMSPWDISEWDMVATAFLVCAVVVIGATVVAMFASMSGQSDLLVGPPNHR